MDFTSIYTPAERAYHVRMHEALVSIKESADGNWSNLDRLIRREHRHLLDQYKAVFIDKGNIKCEIIFVEGQLYRMIFYYKHIPISFRKDNNVRCQDILCRTRLDVEGNIERRFITHVNQPKLKRRYVQYMYLYLTEVFEPIIVPNLMPSGPSTVSPAIPKHSGPSGGGGELDIPTDSLPSSKADIWHAIYKLASAMEILCVRQR